MTEADDYAADLAAYMQAEALQLAETRPHPLNAISAPDQATEPARKAATVAPSREATS